AVKAGYVNDHTFSKVLENPSHHSNFAVQDGLLYTRNRAGDSVMCVPRTLYNRRALPELVIDRAHTALGHLGPQRTSEYIRRWFWW
ncbi:hypothetical protein FKP32DRAFT_1542420, partial [Trametes sanguinea]